MKLTSLLSTLSHPNPIPGADPEITSLVFDSRQVTPGALFVAIPGENTDGHRFIRDATQRGAAAIVAEKELTELEGTEGTDPVPSVPSVPFIRVPNSREALAHLAAAWHGFPARKLVMIGVTGTDGKTTTANLIHSILRAASLSAGLISTVNAVIGDEAQDTGFHVTTPDALAVQGYLRGMVDAGLTHCVLEATSHGLAQGRVTACEFDLAAVTNITHEHLDYHGTFEEYRAAKARLFDFLSETRPKESGIRPAAILNLDDLSYSFLASRLSVPHFTYSLGPPTRSNDSPAPDAGAGVSRSEGDLQANEIVQDPSGLHFEVTGKGFALHARTQLAGRYNVPNCLAAIAVAIYGLKLSPETVQHGLVSFPGVPGRMERIDLGQQFTAIVDFAHTPNALGNTLLAAREMAGSGGRVIAIFGSAGLRDRAKRRLMAAVSAQQADVTILTAEDPRTESLAEILNELASGCEEHGAVEGQSYWRIEDRGAAIRFGLGLARPGDVVIACGKGHEQSMCFGETEYPWDDRTAMRAALAEISGVEGPSMLNLPTS